MDWVVSRKKLVISVPITEEGSGLKQGDYRLEPEKGEAKEGTAVIRAGSLAVPGVRARSGGITAVMTLRADAPSGQSVAEITIAEDFKGSIFLTCTDYAGNVSVQKLLTADGAGAVVEDNAPNIRFTDIKADKARQRAKVRIDITDTANENVTAGIASVSYQVDGGKAKAEGKEEFPFTMGQNQFDFVDYEDFCELITKSICQEEVGGIINICSGHPEKLADRVERFIKENGYKIRLKYGAFPDRPYDSKAVWGDDSKLKKIIAGNVS